MISMIATKSKVNQLFAELGVVTNFVLHVDAKAYHETYHRRRVAPAKSIAFVTDWQIVIE